MSRRPPETQDFGRLVEVAERVRRMDELGVDPLEELCKHINPDLVMRAATRRSQELSEESKKEAPSYRDLVTDVARSWQEGFMVAAIYMKARTGQMPDEWKRSFTAGVGPSRNDVMASVFGSAIDHMRLVDAEQLLIKWAELGEKGQVVEWQKVVDVMTLMHASVVRAQYVLRQQKAEGAVSHGKYLKLLVLAFTDGFQRGSIFEELGGHREG